MAIPNQRTRRQNLAVMTISLTDIAVERLRAKRAYIEFWPIFIFLQDRADFWQTDLS